MPRPLPFRRPDARPLRALALGMALLVAPFSAGAQQAGATDAGAYLTAREATLARDFAAAVPGLERLLETDPADRDLREQLISALLALGETDRAAEIAAPLAEASPPSAAAGLALGVDAFARGDFEAVLALHGGDAGGNPLVDGLAVAWAHLGQGSMSEAQAALDSVSAGERGLGAFAQYCRALMLAMVGDAEGALALIEDPQADILGALNRRGMLAYAQLLGQAERFDDALVLIDEMFGGPVYPQVARLYESYAAGQSLPFDLIGGPAEGMAEVYAVMAAALRSPESAQDSLIYAQAALAINPRLSDARIIAGQIYEEIGQHGLASEAYAAVGNDDGFALAAALGLAQTLETQGHTDEALEVLQDAVDRHPENTIAPQVLGDFLRRMNRHDEAIEAYGQALEAEEDAGRPVSWRLYFSRAVSYERSDRWPEAEADFRAALEIEPDQPTVLNYLGYSLVERQEDLDEALEMIERAVAGEPDSGYITDSLAWALYRLGRYEEALPHMERAVELLPSDPILNDHLGDVYWRNGRQREAEFQWRRAISFAPHEDLDLELIRRKIEVGLDQALREAEER